MSYCFGVRYPKNEMYKKKGWNFMLDFIPSAYMEKLFRKKGFELNDLQKATLIWNAAGKTWSEKLLSLKELSEFTSDEDLREQLVQRIDYENAMLQRFMKNNGRFVYVVCEDTWGNAGYFRNFNMAKTYALKFIEENDTICQIEKQLIVSSEEDLTVKTISWWNPYLLDNKGGSPWKVENTPYDGRNVASITLDRKGQIKSVFSREMTPDEQMSVEYSPDRFEMQYFEIPFEATAGTPVKLTYSSGSYDDYGILLTDTAEWNKFLRSSHFKDFSDIAVTVVYLTEQGLWSHEHINPLYLDFEMQPSYSSYDQKGEIYMAAMTAISVYCQSDDNKEHNAEVAIGTAKRYRDVCLESYIENEKNKNHIHDYAKSISDIII